MVPLPCFTVTLKAMAQPDGSMSFQCKGVEDGSPGALHPLAVVAMMNEYCASLIKQQLTVQAQQRVVAATAGQVPS